MRKQWFVIILAVLCSFDSYAQGVGKAAKGKMEMPAKAKDGMLIEHEGYCLSFDTLTNCPFWVAWELTKEEACAKDVKRTNKFIADPLAPKGHRVATSDYSGAGYDRGHMCPAADMEWSKKAMTQCFYMTNMCPQKPQLNRQWWEKLEEACRTWSKQEGALYICCGPVFRNTSSALSFGKKTKVRVPDMFFKVILSLKKGQEKAIGFIYANTDDPQLMEETCVSVDEVERLTGYDFFSAVDDAIENAVEKECDIREWKY